MPQLDGIRAFAVIFVILSHWFAPFTSSGYIPYGELGVMLFFVLSGFLITGILLRYKYGIVTKQNTTGFYLKKFFTRRALRIFPIYYLTIALVLIFSPAIFEGQAIWHCLYLSNFYFVLVKHEWQQPVSHWWSLAVEEQFYLIWPSIILFVNHKYLSTCILVLIVVAPIFRQLVLPDTYMYKYLTPSCFDALGIGALLALHYEKIEHVLTTKRVYVLIILAMLTVAFFTKYTFTFSRATDRLFMSLFAFLLIFKASKGFTGVLGAILTHPVIIYIGKISYGLYLYHKLLPLFNYNNYPVAGMQLLRIALLLSIASLSYFLIEKPILRFKQTV
jgi:peptidoglycan/LPS O-acetylase OafA/YrhL